MYAGFWNEMILWNDETRAAFVTLDIASVYWSLFRRINKRGQYNSIRTDEKVQKWQIFY